jgi:uncharacterized integral membrane protein
MASSPPTERPPATGPKRERSPRATARSGAMIAIAVVATLFAVLNVNEVQVDWIIGSGHVPLIVVIAVSALAGIVLTYLAERRNRKRR